MRRPCPPWPSLSLAGCPRLSSLDVGPLPRLADLNVSGCGGLTRLGLVGTLPSLTRLAASGCRALASLWPGPTSAPALEELNLFGCRSLTAPELEGALGGGEGGGRGGQEGGRHCWRRPWPWRRAVVVGATQRAGVVAVMAARPALPPPPPPPPSRLVRLVVNGCTGLSRVVLPPRAGRSLASLNAAGCCAAVEVDVATAHALMSLRLDWCGSLARLRLSPVARLRELGVSGCKGLPDEWGGMAEALRRRVVG